MAETPEDAYLGEFRRGPAIFTVFRTADAPPQYRVMCSDGNGPGPVCVFSDEPGSDPRWHGAWNGDEWCPWIEAEARKAAERLPTRVRRRANRRPPQRRRTRPPLMSGLFHFTRLPFGLDPDATGGFKLGT